jgi:hypothetical protein
MRDLERELHDLAGAVAVPPTPDLASAVGSRLEATVPPAPGRFRLRPALVLAIVVAVAVLAGPAVSPARTAILRFFGIGGVQIEFVDRLPAVEPEAPLVLGGEIEPAEAPFRISVPAVLGDPDALYASGNVVTLLYGSLDGVRLLVTELGYDALPPEVAKKVVVTGTGVRFVEIPGVFGPAVWIEGEPHVLELPGAPARLAGNTLVWVQNGRTFRIEGAAQLDDALRIAESMR